MSPSTKSWPDALRAALLSGALASIASTAVLCWQGLRELDDASAPLNGPSQWVWGRHAPYRDGFSARHTAVGYAIHHLASIFWALLFERFRGSRPVLPAAAATALVANVVDFRLTPERLTPGFQKRLSKRAIALSYAAVALGLVAGAAVARR